MQKNDVYVKRLESIRPEHNVKGDPVEFHFKGPKRNTPTGRA